MDEAVFEKLLITAVQKGVSDIHLQVGSMPLFRLNGELLEVKFHPLRPTETQGIVDIILANSGHSASTSKLQEMDLTYSIADHARFRVNVFRQRGSFGLVLRVIPFEIKDFKSLNLPPVLDLICKLRRGLVLVSGATGNGKSTTVASMVEYINRARRAHIVTIEDPIEFLFQHKHSVVTQREVGSDTGSFASALRAALRQDPDVIVVGELRDRETMDTCLKAAETGHLVISTIHTTDVMKTIDRVLSFYPGDAHAAVRPSLAQALVAVVSLRLLPIAAGSGRVPAVEVMRVTRTMQECIKNPEKEQDIPKYMKKGTDWGMQTFDQHLLSLFRSGKISLETAKLNATNAAEIERAITLDGQ